MQYATPHTVIDETDIATEHKQAAHVLLDETDIWQYRRTAKVWAAAALYLVARNDIRQTDIAEMVGVTPTSLRFARDDLLEEINVEAL